MDSPSSPRSPAVVADGSTTPLRSTPSPSRGSQQTAELPENKSEADPESCAGQSPQATGGPQSEENRAAGDEDEEAPGTARGFGVMHSACAAWVDLKWVNENGLWCQGIFRTLYQDPDGGFLFFLLPNAWPVWLKWDGWFVKVDENGRFPQWMFDEMHPGWRARCEANQRAMGHWRSLIS